MPEILICTPIANNRWKVPFQQHEKGTPFLLLPPSPFSELVYVYKLVYSSVYKN